MSVDLTREVWGKWNPDTDTGHPLIGHLLDTAAITYALWDIALSDTQKAIAASVFDGDPRAGLALLAALHDCGKCEPVFQSQQAAPHGPASGLAANFTTLTEAGFAAPCDHDLSNITTIPDVRARCRHEQVTGHALAALGYPKWVSTVLSGHHGRYLSPTSSPATNLNITNALANNADAATWETERTKIITTITNLITGSTPVTFTPNAAGESLPILTGLVVLADWLASDEKFWTRDRLTSLAPDALAAYLSRKTEAAERHVAGSLGTHAQLNGDFTNLFGFSPSRPVQQWAVDKPAHDGLTIVTVPMGEGKTETALWMHRATSNRDGLVFGLPTMATADAMFDRIQAVFSDTPAFANLAHGKATLNAFYSGSDSAPPIVCDEEPGGGLEPSMWFKGPHRALLAPVTVGTCDQVLAAALNHKYVQIRLAALAGKHVVLDEVHTYDPYQDFLLTRLLEWLGAARARVTLLTATLPHARRNAYLSAYAAGASTANNTSVSSAAYNLSLDGVTTVGSLDDLPSVYPAVVHMSPSTPDTVTVRTFPSWRTYHVTTTVKYLQGNPEEFAAGTVKQVENWRAQHPDSRVGVIVNTVNRAIEVCRMLEDRGVNVLLLLHSRMPAKERMARSERLRSDLGPYRVHADGTVTGTVTGLVVVATQIAEASLDVDFDVLFSDACPMPSLLQRSGRLWRHSQIVNGQWVHDNPATRPLRTVLGQPEMIVLVPGTPGRLAPFGHFPYTRAEVTATVSTGLLDGQRASIAFPTDLQGLVDTCHIPLSALTPDDLASDDPESVDLMAHVLKGVKAEQKASERTHSAVAVSKNWNRVQGRERFAWNDAGTLETMTTGAVWKDEDAQTRLVEAPSVTVLPYDLVAHHPYAWFHDPWMVLASGSPSVTVLRSALEHTVPLSGAAATSARKLVPDDVVERWLKVAPPVLRGVLPISVETMTEAGITLDEYGWYTQTGTR